MPKIDGFIIGGQSNSQGLGNAAFAPTVSGYGSYYDIYGNVHYMDGKAGGGSGDAWNSFAVEYHKITGNDIMFVTAARGGSGLSHKADFGNGVWEVGTTNNLTASAIQHAQNAQSFYSNYGYDITWKSVLWSQGEADAFPINAGTETQSEYMNLLGQTSNAFRSAFSGIDFTISATGRNGANADYYSVYDNVRNAQEAQAANSWENIGFYHAKEFVDAGLMVDTAHYSQAGYNVMGRIMGYAYASAQEENLTGTNVTRDVNGVYVNGLYAGGPGSEWTIAELGDYNGDGKQDILWQRDDGWVAAWFMDGNNILSGAMLGAPNSDYLIIDSQNRIGNSADDVIFHNIKTGDVVAWDVSTGSIVGGATLGNVDWSSSYDHENVNNTLTFHGYYSDTII